MAATNELTGPDLAAGVPFTDLVDDTPLAGHAGGEPVLVVRRGNDLFAVGASCTHYGGPLGDGIVVGDTIRCPWHHACFSLRTGDAVGAPALSPISCYDVRVDGGLVRVGERQTTFLASDPPRSPKSVVIVGAGAAGAAAAERLRRLGYAGPLALIGNEPPGPVDRPNLSKDYLAGIAPEEWIPLRTREFYQSQAIELVVDDAATDIRTGDRVVTLASGRKLPYDALLLAPGAAPIRLPIQGADLPHVFTLRTLADARGIIAAAGAAKRAVVIGSSFIGLEAAASLRARGLEVDVVSLDKVPLERVLGPELGAFVRGIHEEHGVRFHMEANVSAIRADRVLLGDAEGLPADLVVMGVGVRPRLDLARGAGITIEEGGILVDEQLRTSAPDVWAAGDVARYPEHRLGEHVRIEHWAAAERQGQAAARAMLGVGGPFTDVPFFWSAHYDVTLSYVGHARTWDAIDVQGDLAGRDATAIYRKGGRVLAVVTVGRDKVSLAVEAAMERGDETALAAMLA